MALLSWSEPPAAAPRAAAADRTTTLSPAFRPLIDLRGRVADDPGLDALRRLRAVGGLDGDRRAGQRLRRDGEPGDLRGDDVGRGAHPGLEALARLVEGQRDRVADRAAAAPEPEDDESTPISVTRAANSSPDAALTVTVAGWPTLTEPMSDSLRETCIL